MKDVFGRLSRRWALSRAMRRASRETSLQIRLTPRRCLARRYRRRPSLRRRRRPAALGFGPGACGRGRRRRGVRTRVGDEDVGRDAELEAVELSSAGDVGERLAGRSLGDGGLKALLGGGVDFVGQGCVELGPAESGGVPEQDFGLESRVIDVGRFQFGGGGQPDVAEHGGRGHDDASASRRASSAVAAASMSGSRLPSSMPLRSCRVSPIR